MNDEKYNCWEHPIKNGDKEEPNTSFQAFQIWMNLGSGRSHKAVAEILQVSLSTIKNYSSLWNWSDRLNEKLTFENKLIYSKQVENVLTSLDIDVNRDIMLQEVLGNLLCDIQGITAMDISKFYKSDKNGKLNSLDLDLLERYVNIYSKLERLHHQNQKKFLNLNKDCLMVYDFQSLEEYRDVLSAGRKKQVEVYQNFVKAYEELSDGEAVNRSGLAFRVTPSSVTSDKDNSNELNPAEDVKELSDGGGSD